MFFTLFPGGLLPGMWPLPLSFPPGPPLFTLVPRSKGRRPRLVLDRLALLWLVAGSLFGQAGMLGLAGLCPYASAAILLATAASGPAPDQDPLALAAAHPAATAGPVGEGTGTASPARRQNPRGERPRQNEAALEVAADAFPDAALRGLVDDWLIPKIVEDIIKDRAEGRQDADPPIDSVVFL